MGKFELTLSCDDITSLNSTPDTAICPIDECDLTVDLAILSSDGILLGAHSKNMEVFSDGFPSSNSVGFDSDAIELSEDAETLKLLLQFLHKTRIPDIRALNIDELFELAEAAEKYTVYSAMGACSVRMADSDFIAEAPIQILCHAVKHNYPTLMDAVAPVAITIPFEQFSSCVKQNMNAVCAWFQYREAWIHVFEIAVTEPPADDEFEGHLLCSAWWPDYVQWTLDQFPRNRREFFAKFDSIPTMYDTFIDATGSIGGCKICRSRAEKWKVSVVEAFTAIPQFHTFV